MHRVVITGGPAAGKTSTIKVLRQHFPCYREAARWVLTRHPAFKGKTSVAARGVDFQRAIWQLQMRQYQKAAKLKETLVFFDRGIPDSLAYLQLSGLPAPPDLQEAAGCYRYDWVFILEALPVYLTDSVRTESKEEADQIDRLIREQYQQCGYQAITVPFDTREGRVRRILEYLPANLKALAG